LSAQALDNNDCKKKVDIAENELDALKQQIRRAGLFVCLLMFGFFFVMFVLFMLLLLVVETFFGSSNDREQLFAGASDLAVCCYFYNVCCRALIDCLLPLR
jgi:hypothetical protein